MFFKLQVMGLLNVLSFQGSFVMKRLPSNLKELKELVTFNHWPSLNRLNTEIDKKWQFSRLTIPVPPPPSKSPVYTKIYSNLFISLFLLFSWNSILFPIYRITVLMIFFLFTKKYNILQNKNIVSFIYVLNNNFIIFKAFCIGF